MTCEQEDMESRINFLEDKLDQHERVLNDLLSALMNDEGVDSSTRSAAEKAYWSF